MYFLYNTQIYKNGSQFIVIYGLKRFKLLTIVDRFLIILFFCGIVINILFSLKETKKNNSKSCCGGFLWWDLKQTLFYLGKTNFSC